MIKDGNGNKYEIKISFNKKNYFIDIILDNSNKIIKISICDEYFDSYYEINLSLEELIIFCKVFKSCDTIEEAQIMLNNYFKTHKAGIKEVTSDNIIIYINAEVLGQEKILELTLNKVNKSHNNPSLKKPKEAKNELSILKIGQKTLSDKLEKALDTINKLKTELHEAKKININLSNQIQEINYENGDKYLGSIFNNKKEGRGKMIYKNGGSYQGEWSNDLIDGKGIYNYKNGNKYDGYFFEGKRNGKGIMIYNNGSKYDGEWKNDVFNGFGILYYIDGRRYIGEFQNDKLHGKGVMYYKNGDKYEGDWRKDNRDGKGVMFYFDGERYEGEWVKNKREGFGRYFYKNGDIEEGNYKESQKVGKHIKYIANYQTKELFY